MVRAGLCRIAEHFGEGLGHGAGPFAELLSILEKGGATPGGRAPRLTLTSDGWASSAAQARGGVVAGFVLP
jgi:hypothetical protein